MLRIRAYPYIEQATTNGRNASCTTAAGALDSINKSGMLRSSKSRVVARFVFLEALRVQAPPNAEGAKQTYFEDTSASVYRVSSDDRSH